MYSFHSSPLQPSGVSLLGGIVYILYTRGVSRAAYLSNTASGVRPSSSSGVGKGTLVYVNSSGTGYCSKSSIRYLMFRAELIMTDWFEYFKLFVRGIRSSWLKSQPLLSAPSSA